MKHSIRGKLSMADGSQVVGLLNSYTLWRLITGTTIDWDTKVEYFSFEVWLNTVEDKDSLFNSLKPYVDQFGEVIDYHPCSHDESISTPCVIEEEYRGG